MVYQWFNQGLEGRKNSHLGKSKDRILPYEWTLGDKAGVQNKQCELLTHFSDGIGL